MRWWPFTILFLGLLTSCQKSKDSPPPEERRISYTREIRPLLLTHCLSCHASPENDTGYHLAIPAPVIPSSFSFPHTPEEIITAEEQDLLLKWLAQGASVDQHWSLAPLDQNSAFDIPDTPQQAPPHFPEGDFRESLKNLLAGDLLPEGEKTAATAPLREGEDTPASRLRMAFRFVGFPLDQANHAEGLTEEDIARLLHLFTTPYDTSPFNHPLRPPTYIMGRTTQLDDLSIHVPQTQEAFETWLSNREIVPQIPDLIAAYSFNGPSIQNIALGHESAPTLHIKIPAPGINGLGVKDPQSLPLTDSIILDGITPFTISLWLKAEAPDAHGALISQTQEGRGFTFSLHQGRLTARFSRYWPGNALGLTITKPLETRRWAHVALSYDGSRSPSGFSFFVDGIHQSDTASSVLIEAHSLLKSIWGSTPVPPLALGGKGTTGITIDELQLFRRSLSPLEIQTLRDGRALLKAFHHDSQPKKLLWPYYVSAVEQTHRNFLKELLQKRSALLATEDALTEIPVMESLPRATPPDLPRTSGPACLDAVDRLGFITTLIEQDTHLLARAIANWVWQEHFGSPLVPTLSYTGTDISQINQLDALARKLIELNWDVSRLSAELHSSKDTR